MPGDDGLRLDDDKSRPPTAPGSRKPRPEQALRRRQPQLRAARTTDHRELVPEREDLKVHRRARPDEEPKRVKQRDDDRSHESSLPKESPNLNQLNAYGVSGSHKPAPGACGLRRLLHALAHASRAGEGLPGAATGPMALDRSHRGDARSRRPASPLRSRRRVDPSATPTHAARCLTPFVTRLARSAST